jgi:hypothetical protein
MRRRAARVDQNQVAIVNGFRQAGCSAVAGGD